MFAASPRSTSTEVLYRAPFYDFYFYEMGSQTWRVKVIFYNKDGEKVQITNPYNINACISMSAHPRAGVKEVEIGRFFLIAKYRNMGHGSRIISYLKKMFHIHGTSRFYVMPAPNSIIFWRKVGFKPMEYRNLYTCIFAWHYVIIIHRVHLLIQALAFEKSMEIVFQKDFPRRGLSSGGSLRKDRKKWK